MGFKRFGMDNLIKRLSQHIYKVKIYREGRGAIPFFWMINTFIIYQRDKTILIAIKPFTIQAF